MYFWVFLHSWQLILAIFNLTTFKKPILFIGFSEIIQTSFSEEKLICQTRGQIGNKDTSVSNQLTINILRPDFPTPTGRMSVFLRLKNGNLFYSLPIFYYFMQMKTVSAFIWNLTKSSTRKWNLASCSECAIIFRLLCCLDNYATMFPKHFHKSSACLCNEN